ncbi:hypothetical protein swp_0558 [Shewanella piezotolerans WP3]|uniref:Uncharacterized protein n=1 Tax=Shewanella piezotolerans (strain WP3 / JCM 13877) TaxID=225849 RepID=B8CIA6_SHEPW|nr:hypothetical protein swp_0558 [Shewanella piezotolerans WP3]
MNFNLVHIINPRILAYMEHGQGQTSLAASG